MIKQLDNYTHQDAVNDLIKGASAYRKAYLYGGPCCCDCSEFEECQGEQCTCEWMEPAQEILNRALNFFGITIDRKEDEE